MMAHFWDNDHSLLQMQWVIVGNVLDHLGDVLVNQL